ncbi:MAG: hypothetical protein AAGC55_32535, partial [Myxococcota bacterium]
MTTQSTAPSLFDPDDPRWTAYVLGELDDAECAALERILADDLRARAHVDAIRATTDMLFRELESVPMPELGDIERTSIERAAERASA